MEQQRLPNIWEESASFNLPLTIHQSIPRKFLKWQRLILVRAAVNLKPIPDWMLETIDYSYRPPSYWRQETLHQLVANIKGAERKRTALQLIAEGRLEEASNVILTDSLSDEERTRLGKLHPALMGGEYLPESDADEVEIARITMASVTQDVISIRARPDSVRKQIRYRVVDEYNLQYRLKPEFSRSPLTLRTLIRLIDTAQSRDGRCIGLGIIQTQFECTELPAETFADFMDFTSEFYPGLSLHYWFAVQRWVEQNRQRRSS
jgi:hypothetical protein